MKIYHTIRIWIAIKLEWSRSYLLTKNEQEKIFLIEIKATFKFFGFDTSEMSDDDIKKGVNDLCKCLSKTGSTAQELVESSNRLGSLLA